MDYSKFLDDNFDVKEWVNAAFQAQKEGNKEQHATTLVMKLQMFIQEVNNVIEESCQQTVTNLPRVMREMDAVRQEAMLLREQMTMVKHDIQKVERDTSQSMQMLLKLDTIKGRMKAASEALQEADNWTTLSADVDDVFESGEVSAIAEKLVGMQQSLQILTDVPDYAERCQYLELLKNRLEAVLSPQVVMAFSSQSLDSAKMYVKIFSNIDRLPQLYKYYHRCQKGALVTCWRSIQEDNPESSLPDWLSKFYDQLLTVWHAQIKWCNQVFPDPLPIVVELLTQSLSSLEPSIPSCIARHLQSQDAPIPALTDLKQVTDRFAKNIENAIDTFSSESLHLPCVCQLASVIYAPYKPYVERFGEFQQAALNRSLENIKLDHKEVLDTVHLLSESVSDLFSAAREANDWCVKFTNGCAYTGLLVALQGYFSDYVREFERVLVNLREKCKVESPSVDSEDWSRFQNSMRIVHTAGDLILHTEELDQVLVSDIVTTVTKYCRPPSPSHHDKDFRRNAFYDYRTLLLDSGDTRRALEDLVNRLEEGDVPSVLDEVRQSMCGLSEHVHRFSFDIVFAPLQHQLTQVPTMEIWTSQTAGGAITAKLPDFSLSPQETITKIGQYLMTLPQQLEPFTLEDNPTLITALKHGRLPYTEQTEVPEHLADLWLDSLARGTMHVYSEQIIKISELTPHSTKQLAVDVDYLCNVLEDLGIMASDNLHDIIKLLQASESDYHDISENMPQRLTHAVAQMRNLSLD